MGKTNLDFVNIAKTHFEVVLYLILSDVFHEQPLSIFFKAHLHKKSFIAIRLSEHKFHQLFKL